MTASGNEATPNHKNVDPDIVTRILSAMVAAPTGGNAQGVEYTVIDDKDRVHEIWQEACFVMDAKAKRHEYTHSLDDLESERERQQNQSAEWLYRNNRERDEWCKVFQQKYELR